MRSALPSALLALTLPLLSSCAPLQPQAPRPVVKRASYSVVAVDGSSGSAATSDSGQPAAATTLVQTHETTKTVTAPASTKPPKTEVILSTVVVQNPQVTKTVDVTEPGKTTVITVTKEIPDSPSPSAESYTIVNPAGPSTTASSPQVSGTPNCTTSKPPPPPSISCSSTNISTSTSTSTATEAATLFPPAPVVPVPIPALPSTYSASPTAVPPQPYDNGQWHTNYRAWNSTVTAAGTGTAAVTGTATSVSWGAS
ncbi:MAG: hypothetical protein Q9191_006716 [Dirinaria sp. TL-2023a]